MGERVRVLIADDSAFVRRAVERMLSTAPDIEVVGTATTGDEAIARTRELRPDVVILDVSMPGTDGLEALRSIMEETPTGVLMLSTLTQQGARTTINALELGAVDFVDKTSAGTVMDIYSLAPVLREKVLTVAGAAVRPSAVAAEPEAEPVAIPRRVRQAASTCPYEVVAIGASTGGPRALTEILSELPAGFGAGLVVAQHMPPGFTQTLADRLDRRCALEVVEAADGDPIEPGRALVIPGGTHASFARDGTRLVLRIDTGPTTLLHRPSVDRLMSSAAEVAGARAIGIILTGMGDDGAHGLRILREAGGRTIAESETTAVIFGMPRAAAPAAEQVLPVHEIGRWLISMCAGSPASHEG